MLAAVDMRTEMDAFGLNLSRFGERVHLVAAAIGKYGPVPAVELMQSACRFQNIQPGTQIQMIGVPQNNLCLGVLLQLFYVNGFYGSRRAYRHKYRRLYLSVSRCNFSGAGIAFRVSML